MFVWKLIGGSARHDLVLEPLYFVVYKVGCCFFVMWDISYSRVGVFSTQSLKFMCCEPFYDNANILFVYVLCFYPLT